MKKFYFSLVAAMMLSASTAAYAQDGKNCENALPFPGMLMGTQINGETWYTITVNELSMFPSSVVTDDVAEITIFEDCDGGEATPNGKNCYFLYPDMEYKMRIVPKENIAGLLLMGSMPLSGAPAGMYCVTPIVIEPDAETGIYPAIKQRLGRTIWYQRDFAYNGNLTFTQDGINPLEAKLTKVELKRGDCKAVSNIGEATEIVPGMVVDPSPYAKAGTNLMAVTLAKSDDPAVTEGQFVISQPGAMANPDCQNRPERMTKINLDTEMGLLNGYYVKDYMFVPATSGTYSFVCKAAEGTVFNVGTVVFTGEYRYPEDQTGPIYECQYEINNPVIVNSANEAVITLNLEKDKEYVIHYDADYALEDAKPSVKVVEGTYTSIKSIEAKKKTDVTVSENPTDGNFTVSSYLLPDCGEIALYDMAAKKVFSTKSQGGKEQNIQLTNVNSGAYLLVVYGRGRSACTKLIVK